MCTQTEINSLILKNIVKSHKENSEAAFVLSESGKLCDYKKDKEKYFEGFSSLDSFQGYLGNCYHIAAIMAVTRNRALLEWIFPIDNSYPENMKLGAYHFQYYSLN